MEIQYLNQLQLQIKQLFWCLPFKFIANKNKNRVIYSTNLSIDVCEHFVLYINVNGQDTVVVYKNICPECISQNIVYIRRFVCIV